jgi:hypothetical protein
MKSRETNVGDGENILFRRKMNKGYSSRFIHLNHRFTNVQNALGQLVAMIEQIGRSGQLDTVEQLEVFKRSLSVCYPAHDGPRFTQRATG